MARLRLKSKVSHATPAQGCGYHRTHAHNRHKYQATMVSCFGLVRNTVAGYCLICKWNEMRADYLFSSILLSRKSLF